MFIKFEENDITYGYPRYTVHSILITSRMTQNVKQRKRSVEIKGNVRETERHFDPT